MKWVEYKHIQWKDKRKLGNLLIENKHAESFETNPNQRNNKLHMLNWLNIKFIQKTNKEQKRKELDETWLWWLNLLCKASAYSASLLIFMCVLHFVSSPAPFLYL